MIRNQRDTDVLMIRRCRACATLLAPETQTCGSCEESEVDWVRSSGAGSIVSSAVLEGVSTYATDENRCPRPLAIIELDDGLWIYALIEGCKHSRLSRLARAVLRQIRPSERFPVFELSAAAI